MIFPSGTPAGKIQELGPVVEPAGGYPVVATYQLIDWPIYASSPASASSKSRAQAAFDGENLPFELVQRLHFSLEFEQGPQFRSDLCQVQFSVLADEHT